MSRSRAGESRVPAKAKSRASDSCAPPAVRLCAQGAVTSRERALHNAVRLFRAPRARGRRRGLIAGKGLTVQERRRCQTAAHNRPPALARLLGGVKVPLSSAMRSAWPRHLRGQRRTLAGLRRRLAVRLRAQGAATIAIRA